MNRGVVQAILAEPNIFIATYSKHDEDLHIELEKASQEQTILSNNDKDVLEMTNEELLQCYSRYSELVKEEQSVIEFNSAIDFVRKLNRDTVKVTFLKPLHYWFAKDAPNIWSLIMLSFKCEGDIMNRTRTVYFNNKKIVNLVFRQSGAHCINYRNYLVELKEELEPCHFLSKAKNARRARPVSDDSEEPPLKKRKINE